MLRENLLAMTAFARSHYPVNVIDLEIPTHALSLFQPANAEQTSHPLLERKSAIHFE